MSAARDQKKEETKGVLQGAYEVAADTAESVKETVSHGWEATKAKYDETAAAASKEANWAAAKNPDNPLSERVSAASHAAGDYLDEKSSAAKYEAHKEAAKR
jgi:hypothetical protein